LTLIYVRLFENALLSSAKSLFAHASRAIGYALAGKGMDTRRLQHFLGHASITNTVRYTAMEPGAIQRPMALGD
jgi:site-specific recombinase XerD